MYSFTVCLLYSIFAFILFLIFCFGDFYFLVIVCFFFWLLQSGYIILLAACAITLPRPLFSAITTPPPPPAPPLGSNSVIKWLHSVGSDAFHNADGFFLSFSQQHSPAPRHSLNVVYMKGSTPSVVKGLWLVCCLQEGISAALVVFFPPFQKEKKGKLPPPPFCLSRNIPQSFPPTFSLCSFLFKTVLWRRATLFNLISS